MYKRQVCWGADIENAEKNYKRGMDCLISGHGRTWEYPQVFMVLDGYSARVIRELYTHIAGGPTRLQASTRYIDYQHGFKYVVSPKIENNMEANIIYNDAMNELLEAMKMCIRDRWSDAVETDEATSELIMEKNAEYLAERVQAENAAGEKEEEVPAETPEPSICLLYTSWNKGK